jgi:small subunit ribosomal protein S6
MSDVRKYELMLIVRPDLLDKDVEATFAVVREHMSAIGAKITLEDVWGKRTLAFPIKKQEKGLYAVFYFDVDGLKLNELKRELDIEPNLLRYMISKTPEGLDVIEYITVLREQAKADQAREEERKKEAEKGKKEALERRASLQPRRAKREEEVTTEASAPAADAPKKRVKKEDLDAKVDSMLKSLDDL